MSAPGRVGIGAIGLAVMLVAVLLWQARPIPAVLGFWFAGEMTFALHDAARIGGAITVPEQQRMRDIARAEIRRAFEPFGLEISDRQDAPYRVAVRQVIRPARESAARYTGAAGLSFALGRLGHSGAVNFQLLAAQAMSYAPPGATRADIIDAIGRGIGRAAIHEFTHQLLPRDPVDAADDESSYEYGSANRRVQYYGELHWTVARPRLLVRYARR